MVPLDVQLTFNHSYVHATRETRLHLFTRSGRSVPHGKKKTCIGCLERLPQRSHLPGRQTPFNMQYPLGRYRCKTAPQGYIASGDGYTWRYDELVSNNSNKKKCVDDLLVWDDSINDSFVQAVQSLDTCGRNGITLNPDKFVFVEGLKKAVKVLGFSEIPACTSWLPNIQTHHICSFLVWTH